MSDDLIAALDQRKAELESVSELFATFRAQLISKGFSTEIAEEIAATYASHFIAATFEGDDE